jgi:hypothetical protein
VVLAINNGDFAENRAIWADKFQFLYAYAWSNWFSNPAKIAKKLYNKNKS